MVLKFTTLFRSGYFFDTSPEDFEVNRWEGSREIPADSGEITSTEWKSPGTTASDGTEDIAWLNPDNSQSSDDSYATCTTTQNDPITPYDTMQKLKCTNFSFSVPSSATIKGVAVRIERKTDYNDEVRDAFVKLVVGGSYSGDSQSSMDWITTERIDTIGGSSNLWGTSLTASQINASNFGVGIKAEVYSGGGDNIQSIDNVQMKVYYQT